MSCYDTVRFTCPCCGQTWGIQTKAGARRLKTFVHTSVPTDIATALNGDTERCPGCGIELRVVANIPTRVAMYLEEVDTDEDGD